MVNKRVRNAVLGCNLKNDRMICLFPRQTIQYRSNPSLCRGLSYTPQGDLPNSGIETWYPKLQVDSLLSESPGKPIFSNVFCSQKEKCKLGLLFLVLKFFLLLEISLELPDSGTILPCWHAPTSGYSHGGVGGVCVCVCVCAHTCVHMLDTALGSQSVVTSWI